MKHEIYFIIKNIELLAELTIKNEIRQLLSKYNLGNHFHENSKTNKLDKLVKLKKLK